MISTAMFHQSTSRDLSSLNEKIASLQGQIATGRNDPRASVDPVRALRLNAVHEQSGMLDRFASNLDRVQQRLDQADLNLKEGANTMRRISELALRAANATATTSERATIATEVQELRAQLLGLANARDSTGQALFGGFVTRDDPFRNGPTGVTYHGDAGQPRLQVSETMTLATGLNGALVFNSVGAARDGNIFDTIDRFIATLRTDPSSITATAQGNGQLTLTPQMGRDFAQWSLQISGPDGQADVTFALADGALSAAVDAVNAQTARTGVSASSDPQTGAIVLSAAGPITVARIVGADPAALAMGVMDETGTRRNLVAADRTENAVLGQLQDSATHLIEQRTQIGALSANAKVQADVVAGRKLSLDQAVANLGDLDMTAALTRLQQHMLNRDATLQSYAKITQQNLFDYMR